MTNENKMRAIKKNTALAALTVFMTVFNLLAAVFTVVRAEIRFLTENESFYANGFTLAFKEYPAIVEGSGNIIRVCAAAYVALALMLAVAVAVFFIVKRSLDFGKFGIFAVIASLVLSVFYTVIGIVAYCAASDYAGLYYQCSTAAFWPLVFMAFSAFLFFAARYKMPDELEF